MTEQPLAFLAKLAASVPRPRANLTRYRGVFAPNSAHRALVNRAGRARAGLKRFTYYCQFSCISS